MPDADDVFVEKPGGRVMVIGGGGALELFDSDGAGSLKRSASVKTALGARAGLIAPDRHAVMICVPARAGQRAELREFALTD